MANNWQIDMIAGLDGSQSRNQLNSDIKGLARNLDKLKLYTEIDKNQVIQLQNQLKKLQVDLNTVTVTDAAINGIVQKINDGLKNIQISNINIGNISNQARQTGQQIGNIVSDEVNNALGKITSKEIGVAFKVEKTDSDEFNRAVDEEIRKLQQANNKLTSVRYTTNTEQRQTQDIFGNVEYENIEKLTGAVFRYNTETGEAITKTMKWAQIGITVDDKGNDAPLMGWVQGLTTYNKSLDESSAKTDNFVDKQKTAVTNLSNQLATIESKFNSSKKPLSDIYDIAQVENKIFDVRKAIDTLSISSKTGFTDAKNAVTTEITELNNLITTLQNAEYAATSLRTKDIKTVKTDEENNLNTFVEKMKQSGHYTEKLGQDVASLRSQLSNVFDANTLTSYLNGLSNLQSEFKSVDAAAKTAEKATKIQTNVEAEKKILTLYKNELKEAGVLTGDVKQKIQDMFRSLSKVDSQNGLTTWRAELKGVKAETDAVLKSVQLSSTKEQEAYEVAYKELKKLYDLKIEYAKLGSNKETDFYYGKAIADQEKVWRQAWSKTSEPDNWNVQKRLELEREELVMQDKLAQAYGKVTDAKKLADQANKIQLSYANGDYEAKVESTIAKTQQWVNANGEARISTTSLSTALSNLDKAYLAITADGGNTVTNQKALKQAESELSAEIKKVTNDVTKMNATMAKSSAVDALRQKYQMFYNTNTAAHRKWGKSLLSAISELAPGAEVSKQRIKELEQGLINTTNAARQAGKLGLSFFDTIKQGMSKFSYWTSSTFIIMKTVQEFKQMISNVEELDDALTNISYTMNVSNSQLEKIGNSALETAKDLNTSASNVLDAVKTYANANETAESILNKAKPTIMMSNVTGMGTEQTVDIIQGTIEQFDLEDTEEQLMHISDVLQTVSMSMPYDFSKGVKELSEGIQASGSVAKDAGYDLENYTALLGTLIAKTRQSGSELGRSLRTMFVRTTKASSSALANGEVTEEDLSNAEKALRRVGIEVRSDIDTFKSFDEIMGELYNKVDSLSEVDLSNIAYEVASTRQSVCLSI